MDSKCEGVREPPSVPSGTINPVICCGTQRFPDGAHGTIVRALMAWLESQTTDQPETSGVIRRAPFTLLSLGARSMPPRLKKQYNQKKSHDLAGDHSP